MTHAGSQTDRDTEMSDRCCHTQHISAVQLPLDQHASHSQPHLHGSLTCSLAMCSQAEGAVIFIMGQEGIWPWLSSQGPALEISHESAELLLMPEVQ